MYIYSKNIFKKILLDKNFLTLKKLLFEHFIVSENIT